MSRRCGTGYRGAFQFYIHGAYRRRCCVRLFFTVLICPEAVNEHSEDDPHDPEYAFHDHLVLFTSYAYLLFSVATSIMVSATATGVGGFNAPNKLCCACVSACWAKPEPKASTRGANRRCSHCHSPFVVNDTVLDKRIGPFAFDCLDESRLAIVFGDLIWFWSLAFRRFTIFHFESNLGFYFNKKPVLESHKHEIIGTQREAVADQHTSSLCGQTNNHCAAYGLCYLTAHGRGH